MHFNWVLLFIGAKIAFSFQNIDYYEFMFDERDLSYHCQKLLLLKITHFCVQNFAKQSPPPSASEIAQSLEIPLPLTNFFLASLTKAAVLTKLEDDRFQPALPIDIMTIKRVLDMLENKGGVIPLPKDRETDSLNRAVTEFSYDLLLREIE